MAKEQDEFCTAMQHDHIERIAKAEQGIKSLGRSMDGLRDGQSAMITKIDVFMEHLLAIRADMAATNKEVGRLQNGMTEKIGAVLADRMEKRQAEEDRKRKRARWIYGAIITLCGLMVTAATLTVQAGWIGG